MRVWAEDDVSDRSERSYVIPCAISRARVYVRGCVLYGRCNVREARRALNDAVTERQVDENSSLYDRYMRRLMKGPCEHNWGYSVGDYLPELRYPNEAHPDFTTWPNAAFHKVRNSAAYQKLEVEWAEQGEWMYPLPVWSSLFGWSRSPRSAAVATGAGRSPSIAEARRWNAFVHKLEDRLAPLVRPARPGKEFLGSMDHYQPGVQQCGAYDVAINTSTGAIASLKHMPSGRILAKPGNELGTFAYYTFSAADFALYGKEYVEGGDFGKTGMETANVSGGAWYPSKAETR
eukprot:COSAG02_NODE_17356_length_1010_cov_0.715697_2_plen_289_part_01